MTFPQQPSISRAPITYPYVSARSLGQHGTKTPPPHPKKSLIISPATTTTNKANTDSSGHLTPPSIDSSPLARHPQGYFGSPTNPLKLTAENDSIPPFDLSARPKSPLGGKNFMNHEEAVRSIGEQISAGHIPQVSAHLSPIKNRRNTLSNFEIPQKNNFSAAARNRKAHRNRRWINLHTWAAEEPWNNKSLRVPRCQVAPTALRGFKQLCTKPVTFEIPGLKYELANRDLAGRLIDAKVLRGVKNKMPRRWSSVEIATHRAIAPFIYLPTQSPQTSSTRFKICRDRARTMLPVATVGDELAHIIRSRLMTRRITGSTPQVPSSIVVEHASTESKTNTDDENALKDGCEYVVTGAQIDEITNMIKSTLRRESQKNSSTSETDYTSPPRMKKLKSRVTSFTSRGVIPRIGSAVKTSVTAAEAYRFSGRLMEVASEFNFPPKPAESLGAERKFQRSKHEVVWTPGSSDIRREPGFLEIRLTSEDLSTHLDERSHESSTVSCQKSQAFDPKNAIASIHQWSWDLPSKQSVAFQNLNIGTSTDTSPQVATRLAAKRVGSMSRADELRLQASDSGANLKPHGSESNISRGSVIEEVVSFPPLPRKSTFDWICPLPDLDSVIAKRQSSASTTKKQSTSSGSYTRCLYDQGVDATIWVNSRSASPSPGASPRSEDAGTKPLSPVTLSSSKGMNSLYEEEIDARIIGSSGHPRDAQPVFQEPSYSLKTCPSSPKIKFREPKEVSRIKSGILSPPRTQTRQGSQSTMGSWIGASGHHKRKSLHVAIRENSMRPSTKATSWDKARADSIYPEHHTSELSAESTQFTGNSSETVSKDHSWHKPRADSSYPQQVSFSSTETADADNIDAEGSEGSGIIAPSPNREALVRNRYHVMPVKDHIGIYDSMTGVRRARRQSQICTTLGCDLERGHRVKISRDPSVDWIG